MSALILAFASATPAHGTPAVPIIFDTDMGADYDDVGALATLHALADRGEAQILGTGTSNQLEQSAPVIEIINRYYGRPNLPIGAVKGRGIHTDTWHRGKKWTSALPAAFPHSLQSTADAPDASKLYRKLLAQQPDHSVVMVVVGAFTNMRNLLQSAPDADSTLSGRDLVRQKVARLVCMAGKFPEGVETNVSSDVYSSQIVFAEWPTPIGISGYEVGRYVRTGDQLINQSTPSNPIAAVYRMSIEQDRLESGNSRYEPGGRASYDQTAVLEAVRSGRYFRFETGEFKVGDDGRNTWKSGPAGPHRRLILKLPAKELATIIEGLMMTSPKLASTDRNR